jgi:predicted ATP-dependent Lon-type protease
MSQKEKELVDEFLPRPPQLEAAASVVRRRHRLDTILVLRVQANSKLDAVLALCHGLGIRVAVVE